MILRGLKMALGAAVLTLGCGHGDATGPLTTSSTEPAESSPVLPGIDESTPALQMLAPGILNTAVNPRDVAMTPDGRELYFCMAAPGYAQAAILATHYRDGAWSEPQVAPFSGLTASIDLEPFISPEGRRFYFMSTRPARNLGDPFNGPGWRGASVSLSADQRYLFFSSDRPAAGGFFQSGRVSRDQLLAMHVSPGNGGFDIWWVDAAILRRYL